jgi:hypothetical protein
MVGSFAMEHEPMIVHCKSKPQQLTAQTIRDGNTVAMRRHRVGEQYNQMERQLCRLFGSNVTRKTLLTFADLLLKEGLVRNPLDRLARRTKEALICWFCENAGLNLLVLEKPRDYCQMLTEMIDHSPGVQAVENQTSTLESILDHRPSSDEWFEESDLD